MLRDLSIMWKLSNFNDWFICKVSSEKLVTVMQFYVMNIHTYINYQLQVSNAYCQQSMHSPDCSQQAEWGHPKNKNSTGSYGKSVRWNKK